MAIKGGAARLLMMTCYFIAFCSSVIITGAFAWFTATQLRPRNVASLALGAASLLWSSTSFLLICCTAGISFFALPRIVLDVLFAGAMVAVAALNRSATRGCRDDSSQYPRVVGRGSGSAGCRLFVVAFAVAVAVTGIFVYLVNAMVQMWIWRRVTGKQVSGSRV